MGEHRKKKGKHEETDRQKPPAKSGKDLCKEYGHSGYMRFGKAYEMNGKWFVFVRCERCEAEWEQRTNPPPGKK